MLPAEDLMTRGGDPLPTAQGARWALEPVWIFFENRKFLAPAGIRALDFLGHSVVCILTRLGSPYMAIKTSYVAMGYK
jgi:hypothetical protein